MELFLLATMLIHEQSPIPPQAPPIEQAKVKALTYADAVAKAVRENKQLIVFLDCKVRPVPGDAVVVGVPELIGVKGPAILVGRPNGKGWLEWVDTYPPDSEFRVREAVSPQAVPFDKSAARPIADDSPWLSRAESDAVKQAWPKSMTFPANLKFYSLPARYQRLYTMANGSFKGRDIVDLHDQSAAMAHSGGMEGITGWRSIKGLAIPGDKRISVWEEETDVRAFALVPRWRWSFPSGTVAYDVLLNDAGKVFEVRTAEKTDDGEWAMRVAFRDKEQSPKGYNGINRSCRDCHSQPGAVMDVPGQIYRHVMWGSDQRFSWRPFDDSNTLDTRWPIERK